MKQLKVFKNKEELDIYLDGGVVDSNEILYEKDTETLVFGTNNDGNQYEMKELGSAVDQIVKGYIKGGETDMELPDSVKKLRRYAFYEYDGMKSFKAYGIEEIGYNAFAYCSDLEVVDFGNTLTSVPVIIPREAQIPGVHVDSDWYIFGSCPKLSHIVVPDALVDDWKSAWWHLPDGQLRKIIGYSEYHN